MKFTLLPEAYSSFREPLIYAFTTEDATPRDVEIKIIDCADNKVIGRKRLYGVSSGEVDIAPYLRSATRPSLPSTIEGCGEIDTATNIRVKVEADGVGVLVSHLKNGEKHYLMVVNRDIYNPQRVTVEAAAGVKRIMPDGRAVAANRYSPSLYVEPGDMLLFECAE